MTGSPYPTLYQINTRVWLNELSAKLGRSATLLDVSDGFIDSLAEAGFDLLRPLGVWQTGPVGRAVSTAEPNWRRGYAETLPDLRDDDITGSPFAIQAYRVHTDFGGDAALAKLRARLAQRNIRLLLDFVPNHTARDHAWVGTHPEFYVAGTEADLEREFGQCYVRLPWSDLGSSRVRLRDRLSETVYVRAGDELEQRGPYLDVPPWRAHVFSLEHG